jgi:plastocyanin
MRQKLVRTAALAFIATCAAACGGGGSSSPTSPTSPPSGPVTITVTRQAGAQSFTPNPASVGGQMVVFRNADSIIHRVVLNDGSLDTGNIAPGATSAAVRMPNGGANYHCSLHPDMIGAVNPVSGGPPPICEGTYC